MRVRIRVNVRVRVRIRIKAGARFTQSDKNNLVNCFIQNTKKTLKKLSLKVFMEER